MKINKVLIIAGFFLTGCSGHFDYVKAYYHSHFFNVLTDQKKMPEALNQAFQAKESLSQDYRIDNQLGIGFHNSEKYDDAQKSFNETLKVIEKQFPQLSEEKIKSLFLTYFNQGVSSGAQKKIDEALDYYQKALDLNPNSQETKKNIELLIKKNQQDQQQKDQDKRSEERRVGKEC